MLKSLSVVLLSFVLLLGSVTPTHAASPAMRKALVIGKAAAYGLGAGLVVGLASQVINSNTKNIFLGGSLGMYAGIGLGLYLLMTAPTADEGYEGPDTYDDFPGWQDEGASLLHQQKIKPVNQNQLALAEMSQPQFAVTLPF